MRIVVLPSWYPAYHGDTNGIFFREQAQGLAAAGADVTVIAPQHLSWSRLLSRTAPLAPIAGLREWLFPYRTLPHPLPGDKVCWSWAARRGYARYVETFGVPDVLHVHSLYRAGPVARSVPAKVKIITEHVSGLMMPNGWRFARSMERFLPAFDGRLAVSCGLSDRLTDLLPQGGEWKYIPNSVDTEFFSPSGNIRSGETARIFTVSVLTERKRVDLLISAFDRAFADSNATLVIAGSGPEEQALRQLASSKSSGSRISFIGHATREVVRREMQACDVFALASRHETFGVVLIEAMACGKPVVSTNSGGPASIVTDPALGHLVPVDDEILLSNALWSAIHPSMPWSEEFIRDYAVRNFSRERISRDLLDLFGRYGSNDS